MSAVAAAGLKAGEHFIALAAIQTPIEVTMAAHNGAAEEEEGGAAAAAGILDAAGSDGGGGGRKCAADSQRASAAAAQMEWAAVRFKMPTTSSASKGDFPSSFSSLSTPAE